jgi:5-enolpyruvylshikimate-3-phosphate synthase
MPVHVLRQLAAQRAQLDDRIRVTVQELRGAGASWTVIGDVLGVTRSAAQKRYGVDELALR